MSPLTDRLNSVWDERATTADFDVLGATKEVLGDIGLSTSDGGGEVTWTGADPVVPSPVRIGGAATICLLAKSIAAAALHRDRGGPGQDVAVDLRRAPHRLCPFYDRTWERLGRYPVRSTLETTNSMQFTFFRCRDGSYVMPQNMYPGLRRRAEDFLGVPLGREAVTEAIGRWDGPELEEAAAEAGVVMPLLRTLPELLADRAVPRRARRPAADRDHEDRRLGAGAPPARGRAAVRRAARARDGARDRRRRVRTVARTARRGRAEPVAAGRGGERGRPTRRRTSACGRPGWTRARTATCSPACSATPTCSSTTGASSSSREIGHEPGRGGGRAARTGLRDGLAARARRTVGRPSGLRPVGRVGHRDHARRRRQARGSHRSWW